MKEHYLTEQHQHVTAIAVRQIVSQLNDIQMHKNLFRATIAEHSNPTTTQIEELYETFNIFSGGIETLNNDQQRLNNESFRVQNVFPTLTEELSKLKLSVETSNVFLDEIEQNQDILNRVFASLQETINESQNISYDGTFVWKITNFQEKMMDAQLERQTSIYSLPFFSSPTGYKMRARLYLNGDGSAHGTHMSLFFELMRNLNNAILKFPFNYKIIFCLYDQSPAKRHIIHSFLPVISTNSFQGSELDMNIISGIPECFSLELIQREENSYVRNDTMFIKIMVDFINIPKALIPYAFSLNPALPTHVQQTMIKQEEARRSQQRSDDQLQMHVE
ncbi:unnamed protein product [Rotaria sp. Silwood2]|nr:unnamed protein product [Rotaria sp. Silwood2]CAF4037672.1 unnamed protein product [Rotaria sp. Silwood2]CAF4300560.1 unnamed protein product [Rotaria sp. Silwood2]